MTAELSVTASTPVVFRIGEVAKLTGLTTRTLRYWEELGLVAPSSHGPAGDRHYTPADMARVTRIRDLQKLLGFSLAEVRVVLDTEEVDVLDRVRSELHSGDPSPQRQRELVAQAVVANDQLLRRLDDTLAPDRGLPGRAAGLGRADPGPAGRPRCRESPTEEKERTTVTDAMRAETVMISGAGGTRSRPIWPDPWTAAPVGGVVVIHHMPGYDEQTKEITRTFAAHRYLAICPNLYWREAPGASPDDAAATARAAGGVPDDRLVGDVGGAVAHLKALELSNRRWPPSATARGAASPSWPPAPSPSTPPSTATGPSSWPRPRRGCP